MATIITIVVVLKLNINKENIDKSWKSIYANQIYIFYCITEKEISICFVAMGVAYNEKNNFTVIYIGIVGWLHR